MIRRLTPSAGRFIWIPLAFSAVLWLGQGKLAVADQTLLIIIAALGYNLLFGNAGQFSLGSAAFLGIGAFVAAWISIELHLPFLVAALGGGLASALVGLFIGLPSLRLASHYLIFSTLALHFITVFVLQEIQGNNATGYIMPAASVLGFTLGFNEANWYIVLLIIVIALIWVATNLTRSRVGRAWALIKEHPAAAGSMGIEVVRWRLAAFVTSSFFIGLSGAVTAFYLGTVSYSNYSDINIAVIYVLVVLLGGVGSVLGSVLGSVGYILLPYGSQWIVGRLSLGKSASATVTNSAVSLLLFGVIVLVILMFEPEGIAGLARRLSRQPATRRRMASGQPVLKPAPETTIHAVPVVQADVSADSRETILLARDITVRYGDAAPAVNRASLNVKAGSVVAILGPNGAGKTSLLRAIAGFGHDERVRCSSAQMTFLNADIRGATSTELAHKGIRFVPERDKVFRGLSVEANLGVGLWGKKARAELMREVVAVFPHLDGVPPRQLAGTLSGGQRQMLALASALVGDVQLLVLDEPTLGLAPVAVGQLIESLNRLRELRGLTILMADQGVRLARELAEEILVMAQGRIIKAAPRAQWESLGLESAYLADPRAAGRKKENDAPKI